MYLHIKVGGNKVVGIAPVALKYDAVGLLK